MKNETDTDKNNRVRNYIVIISWKFIQIVLLD